MQIPRFARGDKSLRSVSKFLTLSWRVALARGQECPRHTGFSEAAPQVAWVGARRELKSIFSFPVHRKFRPSTVFTQWSRSLPLR